jgi:hypothetical protein
MTIDSPLWLKCLTGGQAVKVLRGAQQNNCPVHQRMPTSKLVALVQRYREPPEIRNRSVSVDPKIDQQREEKRKCEIQVSKKEFTGYQP